jgi:flagellar biosynthesis protein FlhG
MSDQADSLRQLIQVADPPRPYTAPATPVVAVTGAQTGVGATTVAVNLSAVLADRGERVLLVDMAGGTSNMAELAGVNRRQLRHTLSDVLHGGCSAADAVADGPAGMKVLAARGHASPARERAFRKGRTNCAAFSRRAQQRLVDALESLAGGFDLVLIDLGAGLNPGTRRFWLHAQLVLLVTIADSSALLATYATIKHSVADGIGPDIRLVVNRCDESSAAEAHRRLSGACARFLGRTPAGMPPLPQCLDHADLPSPLRVWEKPDNSFGHAMLWLGRAVSDVLTGQCTTARQAVL